MYTLFRGLLFVFLTTLAWNDKQLDIKLSYFQPGHPLHSANGTVIVDMFSLPEYTILEHPNPQHWGQLARLSCARVSSASYIVFFIL